MAAFSQTAKIAASALGSRYCFLLTGAFESTLESTVDGLAVK
jgi:hypothetical protein